MTLSTSLAPACRQHLRLSLPALRSMALFVYAPLFFLGLFAEMGISTDREL